MDFILTGDSVLQREDGTFITVKDYFKERDLCGETESKFVFKGGSLPCSKIQGPYVRECFSMKNKLGTALLSGRPVDSASYDLDGFNSSIEVDPKYILLGSLYMGGSYSISESGEHYLYISRELSCDYADLLNSLHIDFDFAYDEYGELGYFKFNFDTKIEGSIFSLGEKERWSFLIGYLRFYSKGHLTSSVTSFIQRLASTLHATLRIEENSVHLLTSEAKDARLADMIDCQKIVMGMVYAVTFETEENVEELWVDGYYLKLKQ